MLDVAHMICANSTAYGKVCCWTWSQCNQLWALSTKRDCRSDRAGLAPELVLATYLEGITDPAQDCTSKLPG